MRKRREALRPTLVNLLDCVRRRLRGETLRKHQSTVSKISCMGFCVCVCVLFCFVDPILGNRYGPGVSSFRPWPGVAGSSPFTLITSLVIPVPSSSSSNGPSNCYGDNHGLVPWQLRSVGRSNVRSSRGRTDRPGANPIFNHFEPQMTITQEMAGRRIRSDDLSNNSPSLDR